MNNDDYKAKFERLTADVESVMANLDRLTRDEVYDKLHAALYYDQWDEPEKPSVDDNK